MTPQERISAFVALGKALQTLPEQEKDMWAVQARASNNWFTNENVTLAINGIIHYLQEDNLLKWLSAYNLHRAEPKKIGVVMAGNIPAAGFHDLMCVLLSGHILYAKLSSQDPVLLKKIAALLTDIEPRFKEQIHFLERLNEAEAFIATGSDNSARYFKHYFSKYPHIIRQNRTSAAVLTGEETQQELSSLGKDILQYYGLGCRNVSKLYVPQHYSFTTFFENIEPFNTIVQHNKYVNNYDYNKSILLVNQTPHQDNGFLLLTENTAMVSPISVVYYEQYANADDLVVKIKAHANKLQCVVSQEGWFPESISFGEAQQPDVWDYADKVDTMHFLTAL